MSTIRMPNTSKPIKHAGAIGAAVRPVASVSAAAPGANPDGRGSISDLDSRQCWSPAEVPAPQVLSGLAAQSVARAEAAAAAEVDEVDEVV